MSPRERGSHASVNVEPLGVGSIPAGAGEPGRHSRIPGRCRVYPRGCGGAQSITRPMPTPLGLSPRVRGSQGLFSLQDRFAGSIPAGAGEPSAPPEQARRARVYPRGCGGAGLQRLAELHQQGLSPRVRGSLRESRRAAELNGSIPAGAGEPTAHGSRPAVSRVYPRGCGGAMFLSLPTGKYVGLSPRVRGSRPPVAGIEQDGGSIPAGAGEPHPVCQKRRFGRVYPRGCGGDTSCTLARQPVTGLSPRVRGSRQQQTAGLGAHGSIPAGAGEPTALQWLTPLGWVYPRGCGGACAVTPHSQQDKGLSPRVRGSLRDSDIRNGLAGSIPAGAGEPSNSCPACRW